MNGTPLVPDDRRAAMQTALDLHGRLREITKAPVRREALRQLVYLSGEDGLLAPEGAAAEAGEGER